VQAKSRSMLVAVLVTSAIALLDAWTGDRPVLLGLLIAGPLRSESLRPTVPRPADYESLHRRPRDAGVCHPCSSSRMRRPVDPLLLRHVAAGGMTDGMTAAPLPTSHSA
jgi:hypothetical protein